MNYLLYKNSGQAASRHCLPAEALAKAWPLPTETASVSPCLRVEFSNVNPQGRNIIQGSILNRKSKIANPQSKIENIALKSEEQELKKGNPYL